MSSTTARSMDCWLTGFLAMSFVLAGCWAVSEESPQSIVPAAAEKTGSTVGSKTSPNANNSQTPRPTAGFVIQPGHLT